MRFRCDQCNAQYAIADEKVGAKGVRVRCKKCGHIITVLPEVDRDQESQQEAAGEDQSEELERQGTAVDQPPADDADAGDSGEEGRDATTVDGAGNEPDQQAQDDQGGFDLGDAELGSALDSVFGGEQDEFAGSGDDEEADEDEDRDFDRQATRVFNVEEMQQVQTERDEAAREREQIADLYESARASEETGAYEGAEGGQPAAAEPSEEDRERVEWYAAVDERQLGPMSLTNVEERFASGEFDAETLVWKTGFEDWLPIFEVPEMSFLVASSGEEEAAESSFQDDTDFESPPSERDFDDDMQADEEEHEDFGADDGEEGMYDEKDEDAYSSNASVFAGRDVDWKPSAISELDSLAEEELATLKPPPDPEPESDGLDSIFGDDEEQADESAIEGTGEMDDGDSSIIGQIAAEEEAAAKLAEQERQAAEKAAEEARKKKEEEALAAQEAARREREEEQRERAAPPPESVLQPRPAIPKWVVYGGFGLGGILVILLGFVAYELATGSGALPANGVAPIAKPAETTAGLMKSLHGPDKTPAKAAEPKKTTTVGETKPAGAGQSEGTSAGQETGQPKKAAAEKVDQAKKPAGPEKAAREKPVKRPSIKHHKPKRMPSARRKTHRHEAATVIKEEPVKKETEKKPVRHRKSSGGILDFDDENAFAKETGGAPVARRETPKVVKKELPPLSNADVLGVMRKHLAEFKACNRKQQEIDRSVKGKMVVKFIINPNGRVASVVTATARFRSTFVSGCIAKVIKQANFPAFGGKPKAVPFPFTVK